MSENKTPKNDGGPAFPILFTDDPMADSKGITIRDYFAAAALKGLLASPNVKTAEMRIFLEDVWKMADLMLAERSKCDESKTRWPRISDLPEAEREPFKKWLDGQTVPMLENVPLSEQDAYYPWDYERWKQGLPIVD